MIAKRINHKGNCGHAQTAYARRVCRKAMIAALATTTEETTVEYTHGHIETVGNHEIMLIAKTNRRTGNVRWSYVIDEHVDSIPDTTKATAEEALDMARTALVGPADHTCPTCGLDARRCDCR